MGFITHWSKINTGTKVGGGVNGNILLYSSYTVCDMV